jgi:UDP-glucose 4-epimerase
MSGRVLVIGGGGFLGRVFCRRMAQHAAVVACDSMERLARLENGKIVKAVYNYGLDSPQVIACEPGDTAVIFSWRGYPAAHEGDPLRYLSVNLQHTLDLITRLLGCGAKRIIYASTGGAVYGHCGDVAVTEDVNPEPVGFYGIGKLTAEAYVRKTALEAGASFAVLRIGNAYGPGQLEDKLTVGLVARAVYSALSGEKMELWGADDIYRDYVHADDVASAFVAAVQTSTLPSGTYNVGCGVSYSGRQIVKKVEEVAGRPVRIIEKPPREFDVRRISLDTAKFRAETTWKPCFPLAEGVADLLRAAGG